MAASVSFLPPGADPSGPRAPAGTPECEASTRHGIATPEPVERHDARPSWLPLLFVALPVVGVAGSAVARIVARGAA